MKKYGSERILLDGSLQYKTVILETTDRQLFLLFIIIDIFVDRCTTANWANLLIPSSSSDSIFWCDFGFWGSSKLPIQQQRNKINPKSPVFFRSCVAFLYDRFFPLKTHLWEFRHPFRCITVLPSPIAKRERRNYTGNDSYKSHTKKSCFQTSKQNYQSTNFDLVSKAKGIKKRKKISWCMWKLALNIRHGSIWIFHFEI